MRVLNVRPKVWGASVTVRLPTRVATVPAGTEELLVILGVVLMVQVGRNPVLRLPPVVTSVSTSTPSEPVGPNR